MSQSDADAPVEAPAPSMAAVRLQANEHFKKGEFAAAAALYEEAAALRTVAGILEKSEAVRIDEAVKCYGNLCTVYQKLGRMDDCVRAATEAIKLQPAYPKGLAFRGQGEMAAAVAALNKTLDALQHHVAQYGAQDAPAQPEQAPAVADDDDDAAEAPAAPAAVPRFRALVADCDGALETVMEANRWVSAASLLAPMLAAQLKQAHRQYAEGLALFKGVMAAVQQIKAKNKPAPKSAAVDSDDSDASASDVDEDDALVVTLQSGSKWVTAGTGVITNRRVPLGKVVAHLERPLCVGYYAENVGQKLCVCCAMVEDPEVPEAKFTTCEKCGSVAYCSARCASEYAVRHDEHECAHMRNLKEMVGHISKSDREMPDDLAEIASHVITALSAKRIAHADMDLLKSLDDHADEVTHTLGAVVPLICDLLAFEDRRLIQRLCGITRCNAIQVSDKSGLGVGQVIFGGFASRFNHSCTPNAALDVEARVIRTIRPVANAAEVTISYSPQLYLPREMRRRILAERYYFTCRCKSCVYSATTPGSDAAIIEALVTGVFAGARADAEDFFRPRAMALAENARAADIEDVSGETLSELKSYMDTVEKHCLPTHYLLQELRNSAVFAASVLGSKADVAKFAQQEGWLWEVLVPGALPVKNDKLRNWLLATEDASGEEMQTTRTLCATVSDFYSTVL